MYQEEHYLRLFHEKGWSKSEIEKTLQILKRAEENKHPFLKKLEKQLFWIGLGKTIICNAFAAFIALPLILHFRGTVLYGMLAVIGLCFGLVLHHVLTQMGQLEVTHHATAFTLLPLTILAKFLFVIKTAEALAIKINLPSVGEHPLAIVFSYLIPYLLPYFVFILEEQGWRKH